MDHSCILIQAMITSKQTNIHTQCQHAPIVRPVLAFITVRNSNRLNIQTIW